MTEICIENIKKSPIYNLSMSSLEDFHSNFLCWFLNLNIKKHIKIFFEHANLDNDEYYAATQITRPKEDKKGYYRFDIVIMLKQPNEKQDKIEFIIENKIKSFPSEKQLKEYSKFVDIGKIALLSFVNFDTSEFNHITYNDLITKLKNNELTEDYHKYLLKDYISVISTLNTCFQEIKNADNTENKYNFYDNLETLEKVGLDNVYIKYRTSELTNYIHKKISQKIKSEKLSCDFSFNHKKGTINIFYEVIEKCILGIQIEGNQYRYLLIIKKDREDREKIATKLKKEKLWFNNSNKKEYCGYKPDFTYQYIKLTELFNKKELKDISYEEIAEQVIKDIKHLKENDDNIKKQLK